jgi:hypothetical protein
MTHLGDGIRLGPTAEVSQTVLRVRSAIPDLREQTNAPESPMLNAAVCSGDMLNR